MERKDRSPAEWEQLKWVQENNNPTFHRKEYAKVLVTHYSKLFEEGKTGRAFIPLCGKTLDMIFFADQGHEVVGLEFSALAIQSFFEDNNLTYTEEKVQNAPFVKYTVNEKKITIYQGDLFELNPQICGEFDATFDRGSYVAINVSTQKKYAELMAKLIKPGGKILMEAVSYDATKFAGPPHDITEENLTSTFTNFDLKVLDFIPGKAPPHFKVDMDFGVRVCLITRK